MAPVISEESGKIKEEPSKTSPLRFLYDCVVPLVLTLIICSLSFQLNYRPGGMPGQSDEVWENRVALMSDYYPFSARPFTDVSMEFLHSTTGMDYQHSFSVVQYTLMMVLGLLMYLFLRAVGFGRRWSYLGICMMLLSYPILCAFHPPVYTWDDFWQYGLTLTAFLFVMHDRPYSAVVALALGGIAREATVLVYPVYLAALWVRPKISPRDKWLASVLPVIVLIGYALVWHQPPVDERYRNLWKNFETPQRTRDTIYSALMSFGYLWVLLLISVGSVGKMILKQRSQAFLMVGVLYFLPVTVITTLAFTLARETRLFFPPFLFVIPVCLWFLRDNIRSYRKFLSIESGYPAVFAAIFVWWCGYWIIMMMFPEFEFRSMPQLARFILGLNLGLALFLLIPPVLDLADRLWMPIPLKEQPAIPIDPQPIIWANHWKTVGSLFILALLLRLTYVWAGASEIGLEKVVCYSPDSRGYLQVAEHLLSGNVRGETFMFLAGPGYGAILALIQWVFPPGFVAPVGFNILCGSLAPVVIYFISMALFQSRTTSIIAGLICTISWSSLAMSASLLTEQPFFLLHAFSLLALIIGFKNGQTRWFILAGLIGGAGAYVKGVTLVWPLVVIFLSLTVPLGAVFHNRVSVLKRALVTVAIMLAMVFAWTFHNFVVHETMTFSSNGVRAARGYLAARVISEIESNRPIYEVGRDFVVQDSVYFEGRTPTLAESHQRISSNLREMVLTYPKQFMIAFIDNARNNMLLNNHFPRAQIPSLTSFWDAIGHQSEGWLNQLIIYLSLLGIVLLIIEKNRTAAIILGVTYLYFSLVTGASFWQGARLHFPAEMAWAILVAYAVCRIGTLTRRLVLRLHHGEKTGSLPIL